MAITWQILDQHQPHFLTSTIVDWIDIFSRKSYRDIVIDSLDYCIKQKNLTLYGYVIMTNHLHLIAQAEGNLSDFMRDFKKYTSVQILRAVQSAPESRREWILHRFKRAVRGKSEKSFQVWQNGNHAEEIYSENFLWTKLDYIHLNPVRAGIVEKASHYIYSSASNYVTGKGILESVEVLDFPFVDVTRAGKVFKYHNY